jgi:hypothetical protein
MLDENEFLSPYGLRAVSRHHAEHPYVFRVQGQEYRVRAKPKFGRIQHDSGVGNLVPLNG